MSTIKVGDKSLEWDAGRLMVSEAMAVKSVTGLGIKEWNTGIAEFDPEALTALVWLARRRNGEPDLRFKDVDFDLGAFEILPDEGEPDPPAAA